MPKAQPELYGRHNVDLESARQRLSRSQSYRDLSTICVIPTLGVLYPKVVETWFGLQTPMNQKFVRLWPEKKEVGDAYNEAVEAILAHPELSKWRFLMTLEHDNTVPPDALLRLVESMDKFDGVSALYWTKGEAGMPMIYGNPQEQPMNFVPQLPVPNAVQQCNGIGMGCALFKMEMFKKMPKPWFRTVQEPGRAATQDLWFCQEAAKYGYKFAVDTRVRSGHFEPATGIIW